MTLEVLGKKKELYGRQRIFGGIAWGVAALFVGSFVDYFSVLSSAIIAAFFAVP
jgi:hypothetical protein